MTLAKLTITPYSLKGQKLVRSTTIKPIEVMFNPTSYSISKSVNWHPPYSLMRSKNKAENQTEKQYNAPRLEFGGGGSRVLTLELFFDVTEPSINSFLPVDDVRTETNKIVVLTHIERDTQQPPICEVSWGTRTPANSDFPFKGVITSLNQNFTLFKRNGKPVRANLSVTFTEFLDPGEDKRKTDPELTTRTVRHNDTLSSIANEVYNDPTRWRIIAEANQIDDPRSLQVGKTLTIPRLI